MLSELEQEAVNASSECDEIISVGYFKPNQDVRINEWFTKFLTLRESLWQIIDEVHKQAAVSINDIKTENGFRLFVLGFVAACQVGPFFVRKRCNTYSRSTQIE